MIAVTGATGQLGRLVIAALLEKVPATEVIAAARSPEKAEDLKAFGIEVRHADYDKPETLVSAFTGIDKLLLISANEIGRRAPQHKAVIDAAKQVGVPLIAYTSILKADTSPLALAEEHKETEAYLRASGIPAVILRNGWYTENHTAGLSAALAHGSIFGSAGEGRISSAARADYAAAAAAVLTSENQAGRIYELAGDSAYTLAELAAEVSHQSGQAVAYTNLPEADYKEALVKAGLPEVFAAILADSDTGASKGGLFDESRQLSQLVGRPTTPLSDIVSRALA